MGRIAVLPAVQGRLTLMVLICANWKVMLIQYVLMDNKREICALMIAVGIQVVYASRNTTKLVKGLMNKVKGQLVTANIKNVAKNVPDTTTPPAISRQDTSKPEAVKAVPALNIRLNAIPIHQIPELMLTVVRLLAAGRAVKMTPELITPNALVRPCMNGAHLRKNVYAQPDTNTLVQVAI